MTMTRRTIATSLLLSLSSSTEAFVAQNQPLAFVDTAVAPSYASTTRLWTSAAPAATEASAAEPSLSFIDTELRGAAMRLHTRKQAPAEGQAAGPEPKPYTPTHADYLAFLVDSKHVYETMEDIVNSDDDLKMFRNTGLERVRGLERDIEYMSNEYNLEIPQVGQFGQEYAAKLKAIDSIPEFVCHYYNWYFAHTAGGRMIGKQMSSLLLNKHTLDFYKWDRDLNEIKGVVKQSIEDMAAAWSPSERQECIDGTADAFRYGGAINSYLMGGVSGGQRK